MVAFICSLCLIVPFFASYLRKHPWQPKRTSRKSEVTEEILEITLLICFFHFTHEKLKLSSLLTCLKIVIISINKENYGFLIPGISKQRSFSSSYENIWSFWWLSFPSFWMAIWYIPSYLFSTYFLLDPISAPLQISLVPFL